MRLVLTVEKIFSHVDTDNQRIIIALKDVNDEPPYFINRPLPMQAVVQLNAPPNTPVFTLQARDPDTDANIHYFIVRDRSKRTRVILLYAESESSSGRGNAAWFPVLRIRYVIS